MLYCDDLQIAFRLLKAFLAFAQSALNVLVATSILSDNDAQIYESLCAGKVVAVAAVCWCFKSSQPQSIIPVLRETFIKRVS